MKKIKLKKYLGLRDASVVATVYGTKENALEYGSIYSWGLFTNVWFQISLARHGKRQKKLHEQGMCQNKFTQKSAWIATKLNFPQNCVLGQMCQKLPLSGIQVPKSTI